MLSPSDIISSFKDPHVGLADSEILQNQFQDVLYDISWAEGRLEKLLGKYKDDKLNDAINAIKDMRATGYREPWRAHDIEGFTKHAAKVHDALKKCQYGGYPTLAPGNFLAFWVKIHDGRANVVERHCIVM